MFSYVTKSKLDGKTSFPSFVLMNIGGKRELRRINFEWGLPFYDRSVTLGIIKEQPEIALITALPGEALVRKGYTKFLCYSFSEGKHMITTNQAYLYEGHLLLHPLDDSKKDLLEKIDIYHVGSHPTTPDKTSERVVAKHLERVMGKGLQTGGLREMAERAYFDMLWNIPSF